MKRFALTLIAAGALAAGASADNLTFLGLAYNNTVTGYVTFLNSSNQPVTEDVYIGMLQFQDGDTQINTICGDITSNLDGNTHSYTTSLTNLSNDSAIQGAGNIIAANFASATDANSAAALQLAVWSEICNGGATFAPSGSNFQVTGVSQSILDQAAVDYQSVNTPGSAQFFFTPGGQGGQSQLRPITTPEPASMAALALGFIGLAARRRRAKA